jgi:hypothetical protein
VRIPIKEKVAVDQAIDVAILTKPRADKLVRVAKLVGGTTTVLARVLNGFRLSSDRSITYADPD